MNDYFIITKEFAGEYKGYKSGCNVFAFAITIQGDYVCSVNSIKDFPELFENTDFKMTELSLNDFPQSEIPEL